MDVSYCPHCHQRIEPDSNWEHWVDALRHDEPKTASEALEDFVGFVIEHGGDMGPNGNVWCGMDEGEEMTKNIFASVIEKIRTLP